MKSIFTRMLEGGAPCVRIAEDGRHAAILEACPAAEGHAVVFPKREIDALFDLDPEALGDLMRFAQTVASALRREVVCDKVAVVVYGLKVRHAHIHLIPSKGIPGEIALDKPRPAADPGALELLAARIRTHI